MLKKRKKINKQCDALINFPGFILKLTTSNDGSKVDDPLSHANECV